MICSRSILAEKPVDTRPHKKASCVHDGLCAWWRKQKFIRWIFRCGLLSDCLASATKRACESPWPTVHTMPRSSKAADMLLPAATCDISEGKEADSKRARRQNKRQRSESENRKQKTENRDRNRIRTPKQKIILTREQFQSTFSKSEFAERK
jgi:hypothetical protein